MEKNSVDFDRVLFFQQLFIDNSKRTTSYKSHIKTQEITL